MNQLIGSVAQEVIPIDGKSLRGSYDRTKGVKNLHLVTAWASEHRLVLGQFKVEDHSNEITAIASTVALPYLKFAKSYWLGQSHGHSVD